VGEEMKADEAWTPLLPDLIEVFGVDKFDGEEVVIRGRQKTAPGKQWAVGREFNHRLKKLFDDLGVTMPTSGTTLVVDAASLKPTKG
jgi:small conductance mechanosensitive channel